MEAVNCSRFPLFSSHVRTGLTLPFPLGLTVSLCLSCFSVPKRVDSFDVQALIDVYIHKDQVEKIGRETVISEFGEE
ncbi:hypothetical protein PanWU01x14_369420 [Parasponia andersonii]|uniref:Uncharacterized protein n=1 Tax=Parasponia andersonii TaxID=3476 RepID=A0A2P5A4S5_PARAD|nr:hypothetical protein PanWU01x14_369420 [Parasponia andersonii]